MEAFGAFLDEEWESLSKLFSCEDSEFLMHFNGHGDGSSVLFGGSENVADGVQQPLCFPSGVFEANFYFGSQESDADEGALFGASPLVESQPVMNGTNLLNGVMSDAFECMNFGGMEGRNDGLMRPEFPEVVMEEILQLKGGMSNNGDLGGARFHPAENGESSKEMQLKRKLEAPGIHTQGEEYALQSSLCHV